MMTVCDPSPMFFVLRRAFLLVLLPTKGHHVNSHIRKNKLSEGQERKQVFVNMEFIDQVNAFV